MIKLILLLVVLISCGKKKSNSDVQAQAFDEDGLFYGSIFPMNGSGLGGSVKINKLGDSLVAKVKLLNAGGGAHEQLLHENNGCPITDPNGDGKIDMTEVSGQSGAKIIEFVEGVQESSYSVMLAAVGRENIDFEKRSVVVYKDYMPVGCAELDRIFEEPQEYEPEPPRTTYTSPRTHPEPEIEPPSPLPPPEEQPSWWDRLSDRLRSWWCRIRGRCS